ncbi:hypothetical protein KHA80_15990 [Anaerobacillus sp. HL2]|nr:hypothetical protein KHA80_15990 [Anaerobacillus sp. HL2]
MFKQFNGVMLLLTYMQSGRQKVVRSWVDNHHLGSTLVGITNIFFRRSGTKK